MYLKNTIEENSVNWSIYIISGICVPCLGELKVQLCDKPSSLGLAALDHAFQPVSSVPLRPTTLCVKNTAEPVYSSPSLLSIL